MRGQLLTDCGSASAATLASRLGLKRQKINYHPALWSSTDLSMTAVAFAEGWRRGRQLPRRNNMLAASAGVCRSLGINTHFGKWRLPAR